MLGAGAIRGRMWQLDKRYTFSSRADTAATQEGRIGGAPTGLERTLLLDTGALLGLDVGVDLALRAVGPQDRPHHEPEHESEQDRRDDGVDRVAPKSLNHFRRIRALAGSALLPTVGDDRHDALDDRIDPDAGDGNPQNEACRRDLLRIFRLFRQVTHWRTIPGATSPKGTGSSRGCRGRSAPSTAGRYPSPFHRSAASRARAHAGIPRRGASPPGHRLLRASPAR